MGKCHGARERSSESERILHWCAEASHQTSKPSTSPLVRFSRVIPAPYDPSLFLLEYLPALYLLLLVEAFP
jgi:hypothetical protein